MLKTQIANQNLELKGLKQNGIKDSLRKYLEINPNAKFTLEIPNNKMAIDFINTMQEWSKKDLDSENVFRYYLA